MEYYLPGTILYCAGLSHSLQNIYHPCPFLHCIPLVASSQGIMRTKNTPTQTLPGGLPVLAQLRTTDLVQPTHWMDEQIEGMRNCGFF